MVARRIVVFRARDGWVCSEVFCGDKQELQWARLSVSCDKEWRYIFRKFSAAKTLENFRSVNAWARRLYHGVGAVYPVSQHRGLSFPSEQVFHVHEDLGVLGLRIDVPCPRCHMVYTYRGHLNGRVSPLPEFCFICGSPLTTTDVPPDRGDWPRALSLYRSEPGSVRLAQPPGSASGGVGGEYVGAPVKVDKIIGYRGGVFYFEALFKDWTRLVVIESDLEPV